MSDNDPKQIRFPVQPTTASEQESVSQYNAQVVFTKHGYKIQYGEYILGANTWLTEAEAWAWLQENGSENQ
jgi:hypothetical protein